MAITVDQQVDNLRTIQQKFQALQGPAQSITIISGPLILIGQGPFPQIIAGFTDIVSTATTIVAQSQGSNPVKEKADADKILVADVTMVAVIQQTLNILIGKAGLFTTVPFIGQPIVAVLRHVESALDALQYGLIDQCQTIAKDLELQGNSLDGTLTTTITTYDGLSTA